MESSTEPRTIRRILMAFRSSLTAKVQMNEMERCFAQGASGVIIKPFDPMTPPQEIGALRARLDLAV